MDPMKPHTMTANEFGDETYRGRFGVAKVVKHRPGKWSTYFFEPGQLKADERWDSTTRTECRGWALTWVTEGFI